MANVVLFPCNDPMRDFAPKTAQMGWTEVTEGTTLSTMSEAIIDDGLTPTSDHAIPSPISYIKDFYKKLANNDEGAVNAWRGMLAVLALQKHKGLGITIKDIPLFSDSNHPDPTTLGKVICTELARNTNMTGYYYDENTGKPNLTVLSVFCKKNIYDEDVPFAMFLPSIGICPFKEYPADLFNGIAWYENNTKKWLPVRPTISDEFSLSVTAEKLWLWLNEISKGASIVGLVQKRLEEFMREILGSNPEPSDEADKQPVHMNYEGGKDVWAALKNICPLPTGAPEKIYSDKLFFICPPVGLPPIADANGFAPQRITLAANPVYVVPPIHTDVVESLKQPGVSLERNENGNFWKVYENKNADCFVFEFSLNFAGGERLSYTKVFTDDQVAWCDSVPYLSMWPYVNFTDDSWNEHCVSVFYKGVSPQPTVFVQYQEFVDREKAHRINGTLPENGNDSELSFEIICKNSEQGAPEHYLCHSTFRDVDFEMIKSKSEPYALAISFNLNGKDYSLGCWVLDRQSAPTIQPDKGGTKCLISMDFGTTSTNVYLSFANNGGEKRSISSPGKYVHDLYCPYGNVAERNLYQDYYLFSSSEEPLGKIFTYGQLFDSRLKSGGPTQGVVTGVTGRAIKVGWDYILSAGKSDGTPGALKGGKDNIITPLKLYGEANDEVARATNNFVDSLFTYGLLEAKAEGASVIELRVSYPAPNYGAGVLESLDNSGLKRKGVFGEVSCAGNTEAFCAGTYFLSLDDNDEHKPNEYDGFAILDIGGGTSDFSFWKKNKEDKTVCMNEHSYGFAGNILVNHTIIQTTTEATFREMWLADTANKQKTIERYLGYNLDAVQPIDRKVVFRKKSSTLDYILEMCEKNGDCLMGSGSAKMLQAFRLKYYGLFYLIACHMRKKMDAGIINYSPYSTLLCLAGCGSKGLEFCNYSSNFKGRLSAMFMQVAGIGTPNSGYNFRISPSTCENKEEVVVGLCHAEVLKSGDIILPAASDDKKDPFDLSDILAPAPAEEKKATAKEEVKIDPNSYSLETLERAYSTLIAVLTKMETGENGKLLEELSLTKPATMNYYRAVLGNTRMAAMNVNPDPDTFPEAFALLMLEQMIERYSK